MRTVTLLVFVIVSYNSFLIVLQSGISVSSKTDGVLVLHLPIEDKGDKVSFSILCQY